MPSILSRPSSNARPSVFGGPLDITGGSADAADAGPPVPPAATEARLRAALARFDGPAGPVRIDAEPRQHGRDRYAVETSAGALVLERIPGIVRPDAHITTAAAAAHLRARGIPVPRLIYGRDGLPFANVDGDVWRLMTRAGGRQVGVAKTAQHAMVSARLFARLHNALDDFEFVSFESRSNDVDGEVAVGAMHRAYARHQGHRLHRSVEAIVSQISEQAGRLPRIEGQPLRTMHGDPGVHSVLFDDAGKVAGVVGLDAVGPRPVVLELSDMWQSWCDPALGPGGACGFDIRLFEASLAGYGGQLARRLTVEERETLVHGLEWVTLESAARYAADALNEREYDWDRVAFPRPGEQNLACAVQQWTLHRSVVACRPERAALLAATFE